VLERFTRRAPTDWIGTTENGLPGGNAHCKTIFNPRKVAASGVHCPIYFEGCHSLNEHGGFASWCNNPPTVDKIAINHYVVKSHEEHRIKTARGVASVIIANGYGDEHFKIFDHNEEFDDGILKYRDTRAKNFRLPDKSHADERFLNALMKNLSPTLLPTTPPQFYAGKLETFLTCRAVAAQLKTRLEDDTPAKFFEETSLVAILRTIASGGMSFADARLLIRELPKLLSLSYPAVKDLRAAATQIVAQLMNIMHLNSRWQDYAELDYINDLIKIGG